MVQILPEKTSLGAEVGRATGQGLSQGLQQGANVGFQRNMLQNALSGIRDLDPNASPFELASSLIQATSGIPGAEKYIGTLYPLLLEQQQARQNASPELAAAINRTSGSPTTAITTPVTGTTFSKEGLQELLGEKFFPEIQPQEVTESPEGLRPQKPLTPPEPIGPAEEAKIRRKLISNGITNPAVIENQVQKLKNYQNDLYKSQKEGFSNIEQYQEARQERDKAFFGESDLLLGEAHGQMTPNETSIWRELSRQYEELPNPQRFANTEQLYNNLVGNPVIQFEANQRGLPTGSFFREDEVKSRMEDARTSVQDHLKRIDQRKDLPNDLKSVIKNQLRDQYFNSMGAKDFGIAQAAYATSNLSPTAANAIPKAPPPKEVLFDTVYLSDPKEREKYTYSLANALTKMSPQDSLILMREKALQENYDDKAFNEALNLALKSGRLNLSDYQAQEKNKLSIPQRLDLDSIMEGKRSFWDYFKGKK